MSEKAISSTSVAAVPDETRQVLLNDGTDVQSKVGHVAKFQTESIDLDDRSGYRTTKAAEEFVSLTVEVKRIERKRKTFWFFNDFSFRN